MNPFLLPSVIPLAATPAQGVVLGLASLPICLWIAYSDLSTMRIRNTAVLALVAVFAVGGLATFADMSDYLWRYAHFGVVLAIGFAAATAGVLGAGDAKFAAAMAPFVALADAGTVLGLFTILLIVTFALHRAARSIEPIRALAPDWQSWEERRHFPLGVTLAATHLAYHALAAAQAIG